MRNSNENHQKTGSLSAEINRVASLLTSLTCLIAAYFSGSIEVFHLAIIVVVLPLGCIWYGNEIGDFAGMSADGEGGIGNVVGAFIVIAGWIVLFSMLAIIVFFAFRRLWQ
jgi:hypothetical protein